MRFMHTVRNPDIERVRSVLAAFPSGGVWLVATVKADDGIDTIGSTIAVFAGDRAICDFATHRCSEFSGAGLATSLINALIDEAKRRGMQKMEGFVLCRTSRCFALPGV